MPVTRIDHGRAERRQLGLRQDREQRGIAGELDVLQAPDQLAALDRHEARAEALQAGIVLVAHRLVDLALATERGFDRLDRDAVGLDAAIAATFADQLVDEDAAVRIGIFAALAPAALLGGAGLVVDQDGDAGNVHQLLLERLDVVAMVEGGAGREAGIGRIFLRLVGDDGDAARPPRPCTWRAMIAASRLVSTGWPPVIATASL